MLAGPILSFIFVQSWRFLFDHHKNYALHLGLTHYGMDPAKRPPPFDCYKQRGLPRQCFVYVIHAAGLATFCLFFTHVQGIRIEMNYSSSYTLLQKNLYITIDACLMLQFNI